MHAIRHTSDPHRARLPLERQHSRGVPRCICDVLASEPEDDAELVLKCGQEDGAIGGLTDERAAQGEHRGRGVEAVGSWEEEARDVCEG